MKRWIYTVSELTDVSENQKRDARRALNAIIFYMWNDGPKNNMGGPESTGYRIIKAYEKSDYRSLGDYVLDNKLEIFPKDEVIRTINKYVASKRNKDAIKNLMINMYDNLTKADFTRNLYLRRADTKNRR